jgi:DNA-binding CsgD family transcriptional regulator
MRVVLVGSPEGRARLRSGLAESLEVEGEARTLREARRRWPAADAYLVDARRPDDDGADGADGVEPLTPREIEVLELLAQGRSNKAIAAALGISDQTVKFHVAAICGKLGASNRTDASRRALRLGLIPL